MLSAAIAMAIATGALAQDGDNVEAIGPTGRLRGTMVLTVRDAPIILMIPELNYLEVSTPRTNSPMLLASFAGASKAT